MLENRHLHNFHLDVIYTTKKRGSTQGTNRNKVVFLHLPVLCIATLSLSTLWSQADVLKCSILYYSTHIVVDCGRPPFVFFSTSDTTATTVGTVITYTCFSQRRLVGDRQRTCLSSEQWSGDTPTCVGMKVFVFAICIYGKS